MFHRKPAGSVSSITDAVTARTLFLMIYFSNRDLTKVIHSPSRFSRRMDSMLKGFFAVLHFANLTCHILNFNLLSC